MRYEILKYESVLPAAAFKPRPPNPNFFHDLVQLNFTHRYCDQILATRMSAATSAGVSTASAAAMRRAATV
jgi:hypothetical protein